MNMEKNMEECTGSGDVLSSSTGDDNDGEAGDISCSVVLPNDLCAWVMGDRT